MSEVLLLSGSMALDISNRPERIRHLVVKVAKDETIASIAKHAKSAMAYLVSLIDLKNPESGVFPSRSNISRVLGVSEATLRRTLAKLEQAGLIRREGQDHYDQTGQFGATKIFISTTVLETKDAGQGRVEAAPSDKVIDGTYIGNEVSLRESKGETPARPQQRTKSQTHRVPAGLQWIVDAAMVTAKETVMLMAIAKRAGQRLQDVLALKAESLKKASNPFAYLVSLLKSDTDFAFLVKRQNQEKARAEALNEVKQAAETRSFAGMVFAHAASGRTYTVNSNGQFMDVLDREGKYLGVAIVNAEFMSAVANGALQQQQP